MQAEPANETSIITTIARIFLLLTALLFIGYGLYCLLNPLSLAETTGMGLTDNTAIIEVRAMYGGLQSSVGLYLLYGCIKPKQTAHTLLVLAFVYGGMAIARAYGLAVDGGDNGYNTSVALFEAINTVIALLLMYKTRSDD